MNRFLAGKEIEAKAETSGLERIGRHFETERLVGSSGLMSLDRQKIERRQNAGRVLTRAVEQDEDKLS